MAVRVSGNREDKNIKAELRLNFLTSPCYSPMLGQKKNKKVKLQPSKHFTTVISNKASNQHREPSSSCLPPVWVWLHKAATYSLGGSPCWLSNGLTSHLHLLPLLIRAVHTSIVLGLQGSFSIMALPMVHRNFLKRPFPLLCDLLTASQFTPSLNGTLFDFYLIIKIIIIKLSFSRTPSAFAFKFHMFWDKAPLRIPSILKP